MKKGILSILSILTGVFVGASAMRRAADRETVKAQNMSDKHLALFLLMNRWVQVKQEGKHLSDYLGKQNYKSIAIYGMSYVGERLLEELRDSGIIVKYGIDTEADSLYADVDIVSPNDCLAEVDAIIVTSICFINEIEEMLSAKVSCPIISLEDILYDV